MECKHCKNTFQSASSLNYHQKTAKYCLKLRNESNETLKCQFCDKTLSSKHWLSLHIPKCPKNINTQPEYKELVNDIYELKTITSQKDTMILEKDKTIVKLETQIKELQEHLANIAEKAASRPTNVNTTQNNNRIEQIINNLTPVTDQRFKDNVDKLTLEHIKAGAAGYATYALEFPLKDSIICTDFARKKIKYKNAEGRLVTDPEMMALSEKLFSAIVERNSQLIKAYSAEMKTKLWGNEEKKEYANEKEAQADYDKMATVTAMLFPTMSKDRQVRELAQGGRSELFFEFIRAICSRCM